ncbi:hypothetical protein AB0J80_29315 [Actinoplanes sp. NPDC049548]|uniref:Rv1733c family protein n=1 Tax=Actinoplanes sp. NPDC049548 TaxID=3155152 RepID=UPI003449F979
MWGKRIRRRMPWVRMPLRRGTDRVQAWLTFVLVVAMVFAGPLAAWWTARTTYRGAERAGEWERRHHVAVVAVLLEDAVRQGGASDAMPVSSTVRVQGRWTGPDGVERSGAISATEGLRAGSTMPIWVDDHGTVVPPPGRRSATLDAVMAALLALGGLATCLGGVRRIVVWRLDRRRLRSWEAEWLIVGPRWTRR